MALSRRWLAVGDADDAALVAQVVDVVNRAYAAGEEGLWTTDIPRTDSGETATAIRLGEVAVAQLDGVVVGAVRARRLHVDVAWFGALGVDPAHAAQGIGSSLVTLVEAQAIAAGVRTMQLEVLEADPPHPHLVRLARWYGRRGYRETSRARIAERYPDDAPYLTRACDVVQMRRSLAPAIAERDG